MRVGLLASPRYALRAIRQAVAAAATPRFLEAAAERNRALGRARDAEAAAQRARAEGRWDQEPIAVPRLMADLRDALPPGAVLVNEAITATVDLTRTLSFDRAGDYYGSRGGGIGRRRFARRPRGQLASDRPVVGIPATARPCTRSRRRDGGAPRSAIVYVIVHNREYRILKGKMHAFRRRFGVGPPAPSADGSANRSWFRGWRTAWVSPASVTKPGERPGAAHGFGAPYVSSWRASAEGKENGSVGTIAPEFMTMAALGAEIRSGAASPVEVAEAVLARAAALDQSLHAFIGMTGERALAEARAAEILLRGGHDLGPLHGIPYAVKDLYGVVGQPTTAGTRLLSGNIAARDCAAVRRLSAAGMVLVGKTHTVQFAFGGVGINHDHGTPQPLARRGALPGRLEQ